MQFFFACVYCIRICSLVALSTSMKIFERANKNTKYWFELAWVNRRKKRKENTEKYGESGRMRGASETHYYSRTVSCELAWKKRENIIIYSWSLTAIRTLCVHVRTRMQNWKNAHQSVWCHSRTFYACGDSKFDVNVNVLYTSNDTIRPCTTHHFPRGTSVTHSDWLISHLISNVSNYFDWLRKISPKLK